MRTYIQKYHKSITHTLGFAKEKDRLPLRFKDAHFEKITICFLDNQLFRVRCFLNYFVIRSHLTIKTRVS